MAYLSWFKEYCAIVHFSGQMVTILFQESSAPRIWRWFFAYNLKKLFDNYVDRITTYQYARDKQLMESLNCKKDLFCE